MSIGHHLLNSRSKSIHLNFRKPTLIHTHKVPMQQYSLQILKFSFHHLFVFSKFYPKTYVDRMNTMLINCQRSDVTMIIAKQNLRFRFTLSILILNVVDYSTHQRFLCSYPMSMSLSEYHSNLIEHHAKQTK